MQREKPFTTEDTEVAETRSGKREPEGQLLTAKAQRKAAKDAKKG
jgi:hypothetical protein